MTNALGRWRARVLPFVILHSAFVIPAPAHPADNSQARFKIDPQQIEFRLTFNLYTLQQFHRLDLDGDGRITKRELDAGEPLLTDYLRKHVLVTINDQDTDLGEPRRMDRMWPEQSAGADVVAADYAQRFVDFTFVKSWQPLVETVWIGFDIFKETGDLHAVQAVFEQEGAPTEVSFNQQEPEYLWDTGFTEAPEAKTDATPVKEVSASGKGEGFRPLIVALVLAAAGGTWLLLRKVRRISRGGFKIGPRE